MLDVMTCTCCGTPLGRLIKLYDYLVQLEKLKQKDKQAKNVLIENLLVETDYAFETGFIMDLLGVPPEYECCRTALLSKTRPYEIR